MNLLKSFAKKTTLELVTVLESGDDYTVPAKEAANTLLELKEIDLTELKIHATTYWKDKIANNIKQLLFVKERPKSYYLTDEEITLLFKDAIEQWKENLETFEIDTKKYWFV